MQCDPDDAVHSVWHGLLSGSRSGRGDPRLLYRSPQCSDCTSHCRGAACPSRSNTGSLHRVSKNGVHQLRLQRRSLRSRWRLCRLTDAACPLRVLSALYGSIQRQESAGAPPHYPDVSLRGAERRGNLGKALTFSPELPCYPALYCEIATSAFGLLAMTNL